jgi:hypothetical protein
MRDVGKSPCGGASSVEGGPVGLLVTAQKTISDACPNLSRLAKLLPSFLPFHARLHQASAALRLEDERRVPVALDCHLND